VRKLVPNYTDPMFQIKRMSDNESAQIFTDESAQITKLVVQSSSQVITSLAEIYNWVGLINNYTAYLFTWYDQSGNNRHMQPYQTDKPAYLRLLSDKGNFPAVYIEYNTVLMASIGTDVSVYSVATFFDFSHRKPFSGDIYGVIGVASYTSGVNKHISLLKGIISSWSLSVSHYADIDY